MLHQKEALICWLQKFILRCTIFWCFYWKFLPFSRVSHPLIMVQLRTNFFSQQISASFGCNIVQNFQSVLEHSYLPVFRLKKDRATFLSTQNNCREFLASDIMFFYKVFINHVSFHCISIKFLLKLYALVINVLIETLDSLT